MDNYFFFKLHFSLTLYMTGLIWLVQVIHYPLFKLVSESTFPDYHRTHIQKTSFVIAIPMILEMITAFYLISKDETYRSNPFFLTASLLLALIWAVTFFISVPNHNVLSKGLNDQALTTLIKTNWIRTVAWSLRAFLLFSLLR